MKKKILSILLVLCLCVSVFAGCSLVEIDEKSYQDAIVATITYSDGEKDNIDKRELLLAYSSYGYNYNDEENGYSGAIKQTLNTVIDQHITIKAVKNYYEDLNNDTDPTNDEPLLNDNEKSYLWEQTRSSLFDNIEELYFDILDFEIGESEEDETTEEGVVYKKYVSSVNFENGIIKNRDVTLTIRNDPKNLKVLEKDGTEYVYDFESKEYDFKTELFNALYNAMGEDTKDRSVRDWRSAVSQYVDIIERNFSYMNYKTDAEWLKFEIQRVYDILKNNYLVEKYTEIFNKAQNRDDNHSNIQIDDVINYYKEKVEADYLSYNQYPSTYSDAILNSTKDVDYFLKTNNENYFYVSAIKVNLSASQQKIIDQANKSGNPLDKQGIDEIFKNVLATQRDVSVDADGKVTGNGGRTNLKANVFDLQRELEAKIESIKFKSVAEMTEGEQEEALSELAVKDRTDEQKKQQAFEEWVSKYNDLVARQRAAIFRDYMFKYSDDDTSKNADYDIVFGFNSNTNTVLANSTFSANENVKNAIKELYKSNPQIGATKLVKVDDGYYIFFYAGEVEPFVELSNGKFNIKDQEVVEGVVTEDYKLEFIYKLRQKRTSLFSDKTYFDVLYDELLSNYSDNFTVFQNLDIEALKDKNNAERCIVESIHIDGDELDA